MPFDIATVLLYGTDKQNVTLQKQEERKKKYRAKKTTTKTRNSIALDETASFSDIGDAVQFNPFATSGIQDIASGGHYVQKRLDAQRQDLKWHMLIRIQMDLDRILDMFKQIERKMDQQTEKKAQKWTICG